MAAVSRVAALLLLLGLTLAGCSSTSTSTVTLKPSPAPTVTRTVIRVVPASPGAPAMQLPAETAIGAGPQAGEWAAALLAALHALPGNAADTASMLAWFAAEDDSHAAGQHTYGAGENNPLNVTAASCDCIGAVGSEPSGAGPGHPGNIDFDTPADGIASTAQVILAKYPAIAAALASGRGLINNPAVSAALGEWSGQGYDSLS